MVVLKIRKTLGTPGICGDHKDLEMLGFPLKRRRHFNRNVGGRVRLGVWILVL